MAFTLSSIAAKDGAAATIGGGLLAADIAGGGVGPWIQFGGIVDGLAGVNRATITAANALKVDNSGVTQPISGSVSVTGSVTTTLVSTTITGTVAATQSGNWSMRNQDGAGNAITSATRGAQQALSVQIVDASGAQITSFGGAAPTATPVVSSALETGHVMKASAGTLFSFQVNSTTVGGWVMVFNSTTVPADGAVTPVKWWQIGPSTTLGVGCSPALAFATGIVLVFSTTGPFTKTASATAVFSGEVA